MSYKATPDVILTIKKEIERRKLSIAQVEKLLNEAGFFIGATTIRRVLRADSESVDSFRYETTIRPFWDVFIRASEDNSDAEKVAASEALIAMKNEAIAELRDRIAKLEASFVEKCTECNAGKELWREQIRLKDQRIDRKDKQLDDQSEQIRYLQGQINRLMDIVLGRLENNA